MHVIIVATISFLSVLDDNLNNCMWKDNTGDKTLLLNMGNLGRFDDKCTLNQR